MPDFRSSVHVYLISHWVIRYRYTVVRTLEMPSFLTTSAYLGLAVQAGLASAGESSHDHISDDETGC